MRQSEAGNLRSDSVGVAAYLDQTGFPIGRRRREPK